MSKKIILFLIVIIFFSRFNFARAEVIINEVQLYPTEERFLELYNTGDSAVDLTNWYMQRKTATGGSFDSLVSNPNFKDKTIGIHDYFVISKNYLSSSDVILSTLTLTESNTIQIKKSAEEVIDKVGWGNTSDCNNPCPPNPLEGQSIQKTGTGSWVSATPTPGVANEALAVPVSTTPTENVSISNNPGNNISSTQTATTTTETKAKIIEIPKIKTKITANALVFAGIPLSFQATAFGLSGEKLYYGKYFWNFGDGDSKEIQTNNPEKLTHTYFYPGEYNVNLEYYLNSYGNVPDASDKIIIKVVKADISISAVGNEKDFFVELTNNTNYDADISNWILGSSLKSFIFSKNTIISSKKKMTISPNLTNFSIQDKDTLKLMTSQRETIFDYSASILTPVVVVPIETPNKNTVQQNVSANQDQIKNSTAVKSIEKDSAISAPEEQIPIENLAASVVSSEVAKESSNNSYLLAIVAFVFVGASAGAVYFIRRKKIIFKIGDDFKIIDE